MHTFEFDLSKAERAQETFATAGVERWVELHIVDAREALKDVDGIGFCFLDLEKSLYRQCYDMLIPRLVPGGVLIADNASSHVSQLTPFLDYAIEDPRVDALLVPIGKGELVCRRVS